MVGVCHRIIKLVIIKLSLDISLVAQQEEMGSGMVGCSLSSRTCDPARIAEQGYPGPLYDFHGKG